MYGTTTRPFSEFEEMELAAELMTVSSEDELDQFIGKLFKKAWKGIRKGGGNILKPLGGALKAVAKTALPFVGGALGSFIPIPGVGTALGSALGSAVSNALEAELEGLNPEQSEFELARRFVRMAGAATQQAAQAPVDADPKVTIRRAMMAAIGQQIPAAVARGADGLRSGRWIRRGNTIVVLAA